LTEEWQSSRPGCTKELQEELSRLEKENSESNKSIMEKAVVRMSPPISDIRIGCVLVNEIRSPDSIEKIPIWGWVSKDPFIPILAPVSKLLWVLALVVLWGFVAVFLLRKYGRSAPIESQE
jgi:hypothetical protein